MILLLQFVFEGGESLYCRASSRLYMYIHVYSRLREKLMNHISLKKRQAYMLCSSSRRVSANTYAGVTGRYGYCYLMHIYKLYAVAHYVHNTSKMLNYPGVSLSE